MAATLIAAMRRNLERKWSDDPDDDLSAFKLLPSEDERLFDFALNIRLRGYVQNSSFFSFRMLFCVHICCKMT